eukprot:GFUD01044320.1.p1 GENE.GFUD01044320.1~~GFUD01044320.1.p1  ORF type:complete len:720 (-),score=271.55 GFUD01044320.1:173-2254(-)
MNFMERMKERKRNAMQARLWTETGAKATKLKSQVAQKKSPHHLFEKLKCSPAMKKFVIAEFEREKLSHNYLPEKQVALAVIHRYKCGIAKSVGKNSPKKTPPRRKSAKLGRKVLKVAETETDSEEVDIQEFDEDDLPLPEKGSFSINPSTTQLKCDKQLLVRYNSDSDTANISDSSPDTTVRNSPASQMMMRKVVMCNPSLPCLTSSSMDQPGHTSVDWQVGETGPARDLVEQVCGGAACGWCLAMPGPSLLQLCSACSCVAYCGTICQGDSWTSHKKFCKKMKGAAWGQKMEMVAAMIQLARTRKEKRSAKSQAGKEDNIKDPKQVVVTRSKRTVQFSSQPQFEPSQSEEVHAAPQVVQPKSILRRGTVKLQAVLYSPPIKSLEQHLDIVRHGSQEERFRQLREGDPGSSIKKQTSEKLKRRLSENGNAKLNLSQKFEDLSDISSTQVCMITSSSTTSLTICTPISSPTLVESIKTFSSTRHSSGPRFSSRCRQSTPYPNQVDLECDQELSLTPPTEDDKTRRIDFDWEDGEDEDCKEEVQSQKENKCKEHDVNAVTLNWESSLPSSPEDMFVSQKFYQQTEEVLADEFVQDDTELSCLVLPATIETEDNDSNECSEEMAEPQSSKTAERKVTVISESSSDSSSLAMFSPLDLVSQEQSQDQLMGMFSDPEQEGDILEEQDQEEDILTAIED